MTWPALEVLDVGFNEVTYKGAVVLAVANARQLPKLRKLHLSRTKLGDAGVFALVQCQWSHLQELGLYGSGIGVDGASVLNAAAAAHHFPQLQSLSLGENSQLRAAGVRALLQPAPWPRLQRLDLSYLDMNAKGMEELASAQQSNLPALQYLHLGGNSTGSAPMMALTESDWPRLELLEHNRSHPRQICYRRHGWGFDHIWGDALSGAACSACARHWRGRDADVGPTCGVFGPGSYRIARACMRLGLLSTPQLESDPHQP